MEGKGASLSIAALLLVAGLATIGPSASTETATVQSTTSFSWTASSFTSGDLALRMVVDFGFTNDCTFTVQFAGTETDTPIRSWLLSSERRVGIVNAREAGTSIEAAGTTVASTLHNNFQLWASTMTVRGFFTGTETWTMVGTDLNAWGHPSVGNFDAASIELTCQNPFTILEQAGSSQVETFTEDQLDRGVAVANGTEDRRRAAALAAGPGGSFGQNTVAFQYFSGWDQGSQLTHVLLDHPDGTEAYLHTSNQTYVRTFDGGPGSYEAYIDRYATGEAAQMAGVLAGLDTVPSFDHVA